jgi:hypothetical protein
MRRPLRGIRTALAATLALLAVVAGSYLFHRQPASSTRAGPTTTSPNRATTTVPHPPDGLAWQALGVPVSGRSAIQIAFLAGSPAAPTQVAVWIDRTLASPELIPGNESPGGANWDPFAQVPAAKQATLLAAFNGGLPFTVAQGGFYAQGHTAFPLVAGAASLVIRADGTVAVGQWGRDVNLDPDVVAVRQNLVLLVDGRAPTAAVSRPYPAWGVTTTGSSKVWRSAVGVDGAGNLIYVAARNLDPTALAGLAVAAGCVRAMQLDIGYPNVAFNTYRQSASGTVAGAKAMATMSQASDRYLTPDNRDFIALYRRVTS